MSEDKPITEWIRHRYSVRNFQKKPIDTTIQNQLKEKLEGIKTGPLGTALRITLIAANPDDSQALKGLGTYGTMRDPAGFLVGAAQNSETDLEDFGYAMEEAILMATGLGLGTCWLGGIFTRSSFAGRIEKQENEILPAVAPIGYAVDPCNPDGTAKTVNANRRKDWKDLFYQDRFNQPLSREAAKSYQEPLEMVRLAPSATNQQPWRIIKVGQHWHFYCRRTPGYGKDALLFKLAKIADLQRLDIGIGMCHFELTAKQNGLSGRWLVNDPGLEINDKQTLYISTWEEQ